MSDEAITDKQAEILEFLFDHRKSTGLIPTNREIGTEFGFSSANAAVTHLKALEKKGWISRAPDGKARGVRILKLPATKLAAIAGDLKKAGGTGKSIDWDAVALVGLASF